MPSVKIRIEETSADELEVQKQGEDVAKKGTTEKLAVASIFAHQALATTKQIVNYSISNIGNFTGDYVKQDQVKNAVDVITDVAGLGVAFAAGGVPGLVIATIGIATKRTLEVISENQASKHAERSADYLRRRSGNSTTNGSR